MKGERVKGKRCFVRNDGVLHTRLFDIFWSRKPTSIELLEFERGLGIKDCIAGQHFAAVLADARFIDFRPPPLLIFFFPNKRGFK